MDLRRGGSAVELLTSSYDDMDWSNAFAAVEDRPGPDPEPALKATMRPSVLQVHESGVTQTRLGFWKGFADGEKANDVTQGGHAEDATRLGLWTGLEEGNRSYDSREDKADDATRSPSSAQRSSTGTFDAETSGGPVPEVAEMIRRRRSSIEDIYDGGAPWDLMGAVSGSHVETGSVTSEVMLVPGLQDPGGQLLQTQRGEERHQEVHAQGVELPVQPRQSFQRAQASELPRPSQQVLLGQARQSLQVLQQGEQEHDQLQPRLSQQLPFEHPRPSMRLVHSESHEHDRLQPRLSQQLPSEQPRQSQQLTHYDGGEHQRLQPRLSQPLLPQSPQALERGQDEQYRLRQVELEEERFRLQRQQEEFRRQGEERQAQHRKELLELDQQRLRQHELERQLQVRQLAESHELMEERERLHAQRQELERAQLLFQEQQEQHRAEQQQQLQQQALLQQELQQQELRLQEQHAQAQLQEQQEQQEQYRAERLREPQHRAIHFEEPAQLQQDLQYSAMVPATLTTYGTPQGVCTGVNAASVTTVSPAESTAGEWTLMPNAPYSARSSSRRPLGEKPIEEWDEEDVVRWLLQFSTVPEDLVVLLRTHAITGAVLLTLSDEDFVELGVNKFGYRRLLAVGAQQLRVHLERARNLTGTNASSRSNSLALLQMQPAPVQVKQPALEPSAQQVHSSSRCPQVATASVPLPRPAVAKSSVAVPSLRSTIGSSPSKPQLRQMVSPVWPSQLRTAPSRDEGSQAPRPESARPRSLGLRTVSLDSQSMTAAEVSGRRAAASPVAFSRAANGRVVVSPPRSPKRSWSPHERWS